MISINQKKLIRWVISLFAILVFYFNNETLSNNLCRIVAQPCLYTAFLGAAILVLHMLTVKQLPAYPTFSCVLLIALLVAANAVDTGSTNGYFLVMMNLLIAFSMVTFLDFTSFQSLFVRFLTVVGSASLLCTYLLKPLLRGLPLLFPIRYNSSGYAFINAHLCYIMRKGTYFRNYGLYREPGVFAVFLIIGLIFLLESENLVKKKKQCLIVLIMSIISTFSAMGYLALALVVLVYFLKRKKIPVSVFLGMLAAALVLLLLWGLGLSGNGFLVGVFAKFSFAHSSMQYRLETIVNGLRVSVKNYGFGAGILRGTQQMRSINTMQYYHNTSTPMAMLVYFGAPYLATYLLGIYRLMKNRLHNALYILPILLLLNAQQFLYNPVWYALMFYGISTASKHTKGGSHEHFMDHQ